MSISDRRRIDASTTPATLFGKNGNGDEAAHKDEVQEYAEESEESDAPQEARQDDGECCVNDGTTGHALNGLFPSRYGRVMFTEPCAASI